MSDEQPKVGVNTGNRGKGRPRGSPNKITSAAKEAFQAAFDGLGGVEALADWARENTTEFYKLYARLIPVEQRLADSDGEALQISVEFVRANPSTVP